jgi:phosphoglycerate kinase
MVMSHLGRPKEGVWSEADSLAPVAARLSEHLLGARCRWCATGSTAWRCARRARAARELPHERRRGQGRRGAVAAEYAALCDVYVMDAFGTAHRAQASTHGAIRFAKSPAAARC